MIVAASTYLYRTMQGSPGGFGGISREGREAKGKGRRAKGHRDGITLRGKRNASRAPRSTADDASEGLVGVIEQYELQSTLLE